MKKFEYLGLLRCPHLNITFEKFCCQPALHLLSSQIRKLKKKIIYYKFQSDYSKSWAKKMVGKL